MSKEEQIASLQSELAASNQKLEGWRDWRRRIKECWAHDYRATMTALLEDGPLGETELKSLLEKAESELERMWVVFHIQHPRPANELGIGRIEACEYCQLAKETLT